MQTSTTRWRWLCTLVVVLGFAGTAHAQRTVTLTLNTATTGDTTRTDSFVEVRGAVRGVAPITLLDGSVIDWSDASTLEPVNIGGDYWQVTFQIADTTELTYKFYSQQAQDVLGEGWEADPNPVIAPGSGDVEQPVHFFESQREYRGGFGDRGPYDWRPWEPKQDSVAVWFRVAMFGDEARNDGYLPDDDDMVVGVRGGPPGGPDDWGTNIATLTRESENTGAPGYRIYSGVGYYPVTAAGETQSYKFTLQKNGEILGWEEGNVTDNRTFDVPAQDTTLHWVYYGNTAPSAVEPVESAIIFAVDLTPLKRIGLFDEARGDTLEVRGEFNGWDCDNFDDCLLLPVPGEPQFEQAVAITAVPEKQLNYKYFLNLNDDRFRQDFGLPADALIPDGWEEPISTTGANRTFVFQGVSGFQDLGIKYYNDILDENILEEGETTGFHLMVNMAPATDENLPQPFDPATDSVFIQIQDPFLAFALGYTQGQEVKDANLRTGGFSRIVEHPLEDPDGDLVYEGTIPYAGPAYAILPYVYQYGSDGQFVGEQGAGTAAIGRRRVRYVTPNADGSWPAVREVPLETFQATGALPYEENPVVVGIEPVDGEVPSQITLGKNYPNPFNPTTTFEYAIPATQHVRVAVYDVMGRLVQTLVDGVQPASTYQVTFDASSLASGVYFYRLETPARVVTQKMTLLK